MTATYFTADLHFGHANIIGYCDRPFSSVDHMNEMLVANWNDTVKPRDIVYVLGDICMGRVRETLEYVDRLNGRKVLIPGNHDRCHPMHKDASKWERIYMDHGLALGSTEGFMHHMGIDFFYCHFPPVGDSRHQDRYIEQRPTVERGTWVLHGHVHEKWLRNGTNINVGVDVWDYRPVNFDWLVAVVREALNQPTVHSE